MPIDIRSSIFSFVDFNAAPDACNDHQVPLPAVNNFGIRFQFKLLNVLTGILPWVAPLVNGNPVLGAKHLTDSQCGRITFPIPFAAYPVTIESTGTLPFFDDGTYETPADLLANLVSKEEYDWKMDSTHIYADSCCIPSYVGTIDATGSGSFAYNGQLILDYIFFYASIPAVTMNGTVEVGACFTYGVYEQDPLFNPDSLIKTSNHFKRAEPGCFLTFVEYWSKKNAFDFNYGCESHNTAWLPIFLTEPTNPTNESVYVESNGFRRVLAGSLDEEYILKTDHLTQWLHRKIQGMLQHDFKLFTNSYYGLVAESFTKSGPYNPEWTKDQSGIPTAPASTKLIKNLSYFNSACCDPELECCPPVDFACGQITDLALETFRSIPEWGVNISSCTYLIPPTTAPQTVEIFYRERYSVGAYTSAGTVNFDISGAITSTPNPFVIGPLPDEWQEVEIKAVNECGGDDFITHINNPCETMSGLIANGVDNGDDTWTIEVTDVVYSNWPSIGAHSLYVEWREYPSGVVWTEGENSGVLEIDVAAGYVVTLTPDPYHIGPVGTDVPSIEVRVSYGCDKQHLQVFSNPLADCEAISSVSVIDITNNSATGTWPAVSPAPAGLYDWELYNGSIGGSPISSGTGYWNPGTLVLALTGLSGTSHYIFRVRGNCEGAGYSDWTSAEFDTAP